MAKILIVDDDAQLRKSFHKILDLEGHTVLTASAGELALPIVRSESPELIFLDVRLPGMNGLETFEAIHKIEPKLPVIIMTAYGTTDTAIKATKMGAFDYILKPFKIPDILKLIEEALGASRFARSQGGMTVDSEMGNSGVLIGTSRAMQEVYKTIGRSSATDATTLILGESGTGKELVARAIYKYSMRSNKPFIVINCVAIPDTLLESELFGYEKGAFTGAMTRHIGKIQLAQGGTVFLDEIGDMPLSIQAKILRLLQEKTVERLGGGGENIQVDVRIIAATQNNLEQAVEQGRFREDLYYRLKVITIWLPPLRERLEDIPLLADHFLAKFANEMGIDNPGITEEAKAVLTNRPWPGNVRELANIIQKALIFSRGYPIRPEDITPAEDAKAAFEETQDGSVKEVIRRYIRKGLTSGSEENTFDTFMDYFGSTLISEALKLTKGNRTHAARLLGISRPTLQSRIDKYNLKIEASVKSE